jgi:hypothetical protein
VGKRARVSPFPSRGAAAPRWPRAAKYGFPKRLLARCAPPTDAARVKSKMSETLKGSASPALGRRSSGAPWETGQDAFAKKRIQGPGHGGYHGLPGFSATSPAVPWRRSTSPPRACKTGSDRLGNPYSVVQMD